MFFVTKIIKKEKIPFILSYFYRKMINFANQLRNIIQIKILIIFVTQIFAEEHYDL